MGVEIKSLGKVAFEAYCESKKGTTYDGKPIPQWDNLPSDVMSAWEHAAVQAALYAAEHYGLRFIPSEEQQG